jgi:hypothetical protein
MEGRVLEWIELRFRIVTALRSLAVRRNPTGGSASSVPAQIPGMNIGFGYSLEQCRHVGSTTR